jgi:CheY-like chemotaxis protein
MRLFKNIAAYAEAKGATVDGLALIEPIWYAIADEHLLKQAATNLISNASKFSNGLPVRIIVSFEQSNQKEGVIVVSVSDKGRGMTAEQLTKVMVPFGQIRKAGEARSGTGLGLPLTKAMIELGHKGTLTLASEGLGKGTTATMRVPVQWMCRYKAPRQDSDPLWWVKPHPGATADILVVDDVKMNRMVTAFAAKKLGLTSHEAVDGAEALEFLRRNTYSMVFMDRQMPGMNGDVATEQARANGYDLPIVMTSGDTFEPQERAELKRRGITEFISKMSVPGTHHAMKKLKDMKSIQNSTHSGESYHY